MNYRKNGFRLLGLLAVAALSVMALAAASAQAATPGFAISGVASGALTATVEGKQEGTGSLLVKGLNFKINCTAFTTDEGNINSTSDAKGILLYTGCSTLSISANEEIPCEVVEPIKAEALILPAELANGEFAVLAEAIKALINLTKVGDLAKECSLPFDNVVKGELCLKIRSSNDPADEGGTKLETNNTTAPLVFTNDAIQGECKPRKTLEGAPGTEITASKAEIEKLEKEVPPKAFLDELKYGSQPVTIDGAATLKLTGVAHEGLTLGVSLF